MLYAWIGILKPDAEPIAQSVQEWTSDFIGQPFIKIQSVGPLRDESGGRAGMMMIFEHDSREAAESFVRESPYLRAGLYAEYHLYEYVNQLG
jgi:YCII-related domain